MGKPKLDDDTRWELRRKNYVSAARNHGYQDTSAQERGKPIILRFIQTVGMTKMRLIRSRKAYRW